MNKKKSLDLCIKAISGNINEEEKHQLNFWLSESVSNKDEFEDLKKMWQAISPIEKPLFNDIEDEWEKLYNRIKSSDKASGAAQTVSDKISDFVKSLLTPVWKPAFAGVITIILAIGIYYLLKPGIIIPQKIFIATFNKEHKNLQLPDGSSIVLNYESSVEYSKPFGEKIREIKLKGEAFFSVTKNQKPFVIITSNSKTTVLGTKFDIWARNNKTRIIVKEGLVNFSSKNSASGNIYLSSNQSSIIDKYLSPSSPKRVDAEYLLSWMNGKLIFDNTPLTEVINEIERNYNKKILLGKNVQDNLTITGSFENQEIDSVLTMICLTLDLNYTKQQDGYLIKSGM